MERSAPGTRTVAHRYVYLFAMVLTGTVLLNIANCYPQEHLRNLVLGSIGATIVIAAITLIAANFLVSKLQ